MGEMGETNIIQTSDIENRVVPERSPINKVGIVTSRRIPR